ncbi:MAG: hypothetical protein WEB58_22580 [Planctomycetaceae bacterium]
MRSKPQITYTDDSNMTSCKFCYAEIHARARVCPLCSSNQTLFGAAKGLVVTTVSIVTALASLGMAAAEKLEKLGINSQLASVTASLKLEEAKSEAVTQAVDQLATGLTDKDIEQTYVEQFGETPSAEKLNEIEARLSDEKGRKSLSKEEMIELQNRKFWLRRMHGFGHGPQRPVQQSGYTLPQRPQQTAERPGPFYGRPDVQEKTSHEETLAESQDEKKTEAKPTRFRPSRSTAPRRASTEPSPGERE